MKDRLTDYFFAFIFILVLVSTVISFYRFVILEEFVYFESEEKLPEVFQIETYL